MNTHRTVRLTVVIGVLLISFSVFYYFVIFLPQKEKGKLKAGLEVMSQPTEVPKDNVMARILVRFKPTGEIGSIIEEEFDPSIYEKVGLDYQSQPQIAQQQTEVLKDIIPSERALKAANYGYVISSESDQRDLMEMFGYDSDNSAYTIRNWAVYLDKNLEELIRVETLIEQDKVEKSRPVYVQQPAPVIQQETSPKHCTSNTIGNYTFTNCY